MWRRRGVEAAESEREAVRERTARRRGGVRVVNDLGVVAGQRGPGDNLRTLLPGCDGNVEAHHLLPGARYMLTRMAGFEILPRACKGRRGWKYM